MVSYEIKRPVWPRNLLSSSINVFTAKSSRIRPSLRARVIIDDAHTMGIQCFEYLVNFELNDSIMNFSFSSSRPKIAQFYCYFVDNKLLWIMKGAFWIIDLPASTKCCSVGKRFFTRGDTFDNTIVKQRHTYRITMRRIRRPRSSWKWKWTIIHEIKCHRIMFLNCIVNLIKSEMFVIIFYDVWMANVLEIIAKDKQQ